MYIIYNPPFVHGSRNSRLQPSFSAVFRRFTAGSTIRDVTLARKTGPDWEGPTSIATACNMIHGAGVFFWVSMKILKILRDFSVWVELIQSPSHFQNGDLLIPEGKTWHFWSVQI